MEIALVTAITLSTLVLALRSERRFVIGGTIIVAIITSGAFAFSRPGSSSPSANVPKKATTAFGYVTSSACLGCHPGEHASWRRTYHRTMTQIASAQTVLAPIEPPLELHTQDQSIWVTLPDPDLVIENKTAPLVNRQIVLTTGSHREQAYWVAGRRPGDLRLVPFVWLIKEKTRLPRREAFLLPPDMAMPPVRWNSSCIACHAVAGEPRHDLATDSFDTRAVDLGIACESCHGPGAEHVEQFRDPVARYAMHSKKSSEKSFDSMKIIHPKRISPERSAALCGQCHAYSFPKDENTFWISGYSRAFRAGDALEPSRSLLQQKSAGTHTDAPTESLFWPDDGSVRVGGREYNGMIESACYLRGEGDRKITCVSCHSMHKGDPRGQMNPELTAGNLACTSKCHSSSATPEHSHHAPGSPGSACVSCHMPKTSYALLSSVRSHRIDSPSAAAASKPNACNLCHLDKSLAWAEKNLHDWFKRPPVRAQDLAEIPFGAEAGLAGDASVRALIADALGSPDAMKASNPATLRAIVDRVALHETYPAVTFIAKRSQSRLPATGQAIDDVDVGTLLDRRDQRPIMIAE